MSFLAIFQSHSLLGRVVTPAGDAGYWAPPVDVYETATDFVIELELPGTAVGDVHVTAAPDGLLIEGVKGERLRDPAAGVGRFLCVERSSGPFRRMVPLPAHVDRSGASARFRDGVLTVRLPKRAIEIRPEP